MMEDILRPDNHELFDHVKLRLVSRDPVISWEEIALEFGVEVKDLLDWFEAYRLPLPPAILARSGPGPRSPELRAELGRLRQRETSLITVSTEAPLQLERIQQRIHRLERAR